MARAPDERYDQAIVLYKQGTKLVDIASQLNLPEGTIRRWKSTHKWDSERSDKKSERSHKNKGGQPGNKNATGPPENKNAEKHGFFTKWLPEETMEIMQTIQSLNPLDILWDNIMLQYTAIIRAQKIMHVTGKDEMIKEVKKIYTKTSNRETKKTNSSTQEEEIEYEFQFAWDRQATYMNAQSRAMKTLEGMLVRYDDLLHRNWDKASEEQKLRIAKLRYEVSQLSGGESSETGIKDFLKAVKPTKEEIEALYADEEVTEDAEETQEE
jgi:uncharacterized protein YjcR